MKCSIVAAAAAAACLASVAIAQGPRPAITTETIYSCPSALTEYLTLTVVLATNSTQTLAVGVPTTTTEIAEQPVPTTTTAVVYQRVNTTTTAYQPVTIVQTVTTTATVFNVSITTVIPPPITQTTSTSTTTTTSETLYPIVSIRTTTEQVTSLTICPTRTINPTFTAQYPIPTEFTWGCPPGYLCKPDQINCNFEAGLPAENFYCSPDQCQAASALGVPQEWGQSIYSNSSPASDPSLHFNAIDHYFNMNPQDYGLSYELFVVEEAFTITSTIGYAPTPTVAARQAETSVPSACYPWCNNCLIEAQSVGKTPALCAPGSAFEQDLQDCQQCISYHASDTTGSFVQVAPQFQQFMAYCNALSAPAPSPTPPVTIYSTSVLTVQPELSLTSTATVTYSSTPTSKASPVETATITYSSTSISQVSPVETATGSSTEWLVPSGSATITLDASPALTTQWILGSLTFASSPMISASVIVYAANSTSTIALLTSSTTAVMTSSATNPTIVVPTSAKASTESSVGISSSIATSSATKSSLSSPSAASSTHTGAASSIILGMGNSGSLLSALCAMLLVIGDW